MSEKHYPYCGGSFDRIVFDGDGSVWVPESENAKLRESVKRLMTQRDERLARAEADNEKLRELAKVCLRTIANNAECELSCPYGRDCNITDCRIELMADELGIEVDDG